MRAFPRERFSAEIQLTPASVAEFAETVGDDNPVHHDRAFAATTRFGRPIASGTQTTALLLGLTASHFSKRGAMLGLEFWVGSGAHSPSQDGARFSGKGRMPSGASAVSQCTAITDFFKS